MPGLKDIMYPAGTESFSLWHQHRAWPEGTSVLADKLLVPKMMMEDYSI